MSKSRTGQSLKGPKSSAKCMSILILTVVLLHADQVGIFALSWDVSPAHISCQLRWQPRNSWKMIVTAAQNSSSKTMLYVTHDSQSRMHSLSCKNFLSKYTCSHEIVGHGTHPRALFTSFQSGLSKILPSELLIVAGTLPLHEIEKLPLKLCTTK